MRPRAAVPARFFLILATLAAGAAVAGAVTASPAAAQPERRPYLFKDARGELAQARARGESEVVLVIASMPGRNAQVAAAIEGMGGRVGFRADDVDYVRAWVPVERVEELVALGDVHSVDVSITGRPRSFGLAGGEAEAPGLPAGESGPAEAAPADTVWPPVLGDRPLSNRYSPLGDMRALEFRENNPTWDGRGVRIGMIDMLPDMLLPELQTARAMDGSEIPKIAVYRNVLDPEIEDNGWWLDMDDMVQAAGGSFVYRDSSYTAPRDGLFRIAMFDEVRADTMGVYGSSLERDVNRDGNPEGSSRLFGVLWDEDAGDVWVDTDQDLDFSDETTLGEYDEHPVFGVFGTDDPDTPVRESVGFGVQIDRERGRVALNLGIASHGTLVVGAVLASRGQRGRFDGVAPGAQLVSVGEGGSAYGQTEATIVAGRTSDLVYFEQSSNITRNYLLRDGRLVPSVIADRLVERYGVSIFSPTHNFPILGAIDDIVMGRGVIGIGGHESKDNFFMNHGVRVEHDDNLLITGGYGPMGDGTLKPDVISPSNYVSTWLGFIEGRAMAGLFQLPPGYTIAGGTSTATPTATGAGALLISAARQAGIPIDPYRLKYAITRGARWVPNIAAYKQGNGVVSVAGAWDILQQLESGALAVDIEARSSVVTPYSHLLPTPHVGFGLYERSGWKAGERGERTVTFTRTSGPSGNMTFDVGWEGNDHGTYSSPLTVTLPLNTPVDFPVTVTPAGHGVHTAHLTLDHDDVAGYAHRSHAAIVAPEPLNSANGYTAKQEAEVPRPGLKSYFFDVPEGVTALKIDVAWEERPVTLGVFRPDTRGQRGEMIRSDAGGITQVVANPIAGTWEVRLGDIADTRTFDWEQAREHEPVPPTPATLTVSALAADVEVVAAGMAADNGAPATAGAGVAGTGTHQVWITNRMASFTGGAVNTPVGSARREYNSIAPLGQQVYEIEVLPGSSALMVRTEVERDAAGDAAAGGTSSADLDVYVFDCTGDECTGVRVDGDPVGDESVVVHNPAAGRWKVVVDAASATGDVFYQYLDVVFNPAYGTVSAIDMPQERAPDARWTTTAHAWTALAAHGEGREPYLALVVEGHSGATPYRVTIGEVR
ncbi:MAG: S8 family serine peptidase [Gemmatimonadetes bacterium]|nr:S8 family serine peptidase [Gemmatimonadota bacterium]